jgi:hypothetical protein
MFVGNAKSGNGSKVISLFAIRNQHLFCKDIIYVRVLRIASPL